MRLDKYLKVSRIIKRRVIAKEYIDRGLVKLNGKIAKASSLVNIDDTLEITFKNETSYYKIINIFESATEEKAKTMYQKEEK